MRKLSKISMVLGVFTLGAILGKHLERKNKCNGRIGQQSTADLLVGLISSNTSGTAYTLFMPSGIKDSKTVHVVVDSKKEAVENWQRVKAILGQRKLVDRLAPVKMVYADIGNHELAIAKDGNLYME